MRWTVRRTVVAGVVLCALGGVGRAAEVPPSEPAETLLEQASKALKEMKLGPGSLDVTLTLRGRYEFLDNFNIKQYGTGKDDDLLLERARIDFDYHVGEDFRAFVQVQDAHFWLSDLHVRDFEPSCPYQDPADLRQAFVELTHLGETPLGVKVGRQLLQYGDEHVLGPGEWGNSGRYTWDAVKAVWDDEPVALDVFFARRLEYDPHGFDDTYFDFRLLGAYARIKDLPLTLDAFWTYKYDEHRRTVGESGQPGDEHRHTLGLYADGVAAERLDYGGTIACQFGDFGPDDIRAYGFNARTGYTFDLPWQPRLGGEVTYASGDSSPTDGRHETFDGVFGAVAKYYGRMNLFAWENLEDYQAGLSVKPVKGLKVSLDHHFFRLAEARDAWYYCTGKPQRRDPTGSAGQTLGQEIDLVGQYKVSDRVTLTGGYSHFFPGGFVESTGPGGDADWLFLQFELSI